MSPLAGRLVEKFVQTAQIVELPGRAVRMQDEGVVEVNLEEVDPIQLAELADAAKTAKKRYLALEGEYQVARREHMEAQARFMAYLQQ